MELNTTEYTVLGLLAFDERSGYDLNKLASRSAGLIWAPARRNVYNVLPRLVSHGLATRRDIPQTRRPGKHLYRITDEGLATLRSWLEAEEPPGADHRVFLLKIFFGGFAATELTVSRMRRYRESLARAAHTYAEIEQRVTDDPADRLPYLTLKHAMARTDASIRWADDALEELARQTRTEAAARSASNTAASTSPRSSPSA
jgi:PadR family transcriptional regulator AphA